MKRTYIFIILFILLVFPANSFAMDYYPELGVDPFYSELNPTYEKEDSDDDIDKESFVDLIKFKIQERRNKAALKKAEKINSDAELQTENQSNLINSDDYSENAEINVSDKKDSVSEESIENAEVTKAKDASFVRRVKVKDLEKEEKERNKANSNVQKNKFSLFKPKKQKVAEEPSSEPQIELSADYMEYFPDRYEVEAVGNARIHFTKEETVLTANKIIYNYDRNVVKANENVVLYTKDSFTEGDYLKLDLSKPDGWIENPITNTEDIRLSAKEAFVYSDKIEEYDGVAKVLKNEVLAFRANSFASYVDKGGILSNRVKKVPNDNSGVYSLKAKTIYIDSRKDHEVITIKNADLYLKKYKIAVIPSAKIVSNKENTVIESNIPEIGSQSMLGMHVGPSVVLNVPGGSTLKLAPILTYSKERIGIGGIARYRNQYNMTEVAYGTSRDELLIRGRQKLAPGLLLNYSRLTNQSEWFLGYRRPKYSANLTYSRRDYVKDLKLTFSQMYSAGLFVDNRKNYDFSDTEARFRWMTQSYKNFYTYKNEEANVGFNVGLVAQTAATVYTTGDVQGLFRIGPAVRTQVGPWNQSLMYLQTASAGQSPFYFDRYRYGRSNVILVESLKICKYLSVGYLASIAMNRDVKSDDLFQENRFLVSVGPDYAKLTLGYDSIRKNTMLILSMLVGTKDSEIAFKKTVLKNPESFGKKSAKKKPKKKNYKKYLKEKI